MEEPHLSRLILRMAHILLAAELDVDKYIQVLVLISLGLVSLSITTVERIL